MTSLSNNPASARRRLCRAWRRRAWRSAQLMPILSALVGCWRPHTPTEAELNRGLIYIFPGIEGGPWSMAAAYRAFRDAGVESAIRIYEWPDGAAALTNLMSHERNRLEAARIAADIAAYRRAFPRQPIDLVGYSGGGGMAVMTVEALPSDVRVRNVILVQAALSREYDLTNLLWHVDGRLVNFHSPRDWVILGVGTRVCGTMDRTRGPAAGKDGFDLKRAVADESLHDCVEQVSWNVGMLWTGHYGGHYPIVLGEWNRRYIAPYLISPPVGPCPDQ